MWKSKTVENSERDGNTRPPGMPLEESVSQESTLMAEREDELKSLLMKVKEESEKVGLKNNLQKN